MTSIDQPGSSAPHGWFPMLTPRVPAPHVLVMMAIRPWPRWFQDIDDAHVDGELPTMMYGMGLVGIIVVVLGVLGVIALVKYLT